MAVVGHYHLLKFLTSKKFDENDEPEGGLLLWNAEAI
jgi:hypothetical protein